MSFSHLILASLSHAAGTLINQNDDGGINVPADPVTGDHYDTFLEQAVPPAGDYTVTVMAFSNFAIGPTLSDGFDDGDLNGRTANFAFDGAGVRTPSPDQAR